ncbi:hypothetical protein [Mycobacterium parmense]|nr:hypothetical protein [Mycobacterium parmense]
MQATEAPPGLRERKKIRTRQAISREAIGHRIGRDPADFELRL